MNSQGPYIENPTGRGALGGRTVADHWRSVKGQAFARSERKLAEDAKTALIEYLSTFDWEWYATFTFRDPETKAGPAYRAWGSLCGYLRDRGVEPQYFRGIEYQNRGTPHFHALMKNMGTVQRMQVKHWWDKHHGISRVFPYDRQLGARFYVAKYVLKDNSRLGDWALEVGGQKNLFRT